ncbi:MAG: Tic22 family protein [Pseudanabaenaceae cyanobacterium bins.39]|nr:Tic22 family protein [Pseudanabaenaceae cyanobacterium bins.39]
MSVFKSLIKLTATTTIAGAIAVSPLYNPKAEALTESQVLERLGSIPVFTITDDKGSPLLGAMPTAPNAKPEDSKQILFFFLSPKEAQMMLEEVKKSSPEVGKKAQIIVRSMNDAYKVIKDNKDAKIVFQFIPAKASVDSARTILATQGVAADKIPNVPVFFAIGGQANNQGLLTMSIDQNGKKEQVIPFFLDQSDLQSLLERAGKEQPDVAKSTKIQVTSLFQVLDSMVTKDNKPNPDVERFQFVPSRSSFEYILQNSQQSAVPKTIPATPATPAKPK